MKVRAGFHQVRERTIDPVSLFADTSGMSSVADIEAALPSLSPGELRRVAARVDELFRRVKGTAIYDDSHGLLSDADLIIAADQAFQLYDREEADSHDGSAR
jgi:hypothetical protein